MKNGADPGTVNVVYEKLLKESPALVGGGVLNVELYPHVSLPLHGT